MGVVLRIAVVVCIAVALVVAGCGSESEQPFDVYLAVMDNAEDNSQLALDEAFAEYNSAIAQMQADSEIVAAFSQVLREIGSITGVHYGAIRSADPPPEVEQLHNDALRAQADIIELLSDLQVRATQAESSADVEELLIEMNAGLEFSAARERMQKAICEIQAIGTERGSNVVDIGCEE